ncbi:zinc-binding dehydrogenase [Spongiactinospora sp. TRM90649]|uniref:zinc-binding dehydrogenase n=1 Tax=Spongiactinospora sp. TRM90649 TaxID=3031114 RepID=UPI0023F6BB17|nr:zinc-binding dehydrogenase [Spongiactinospora sp. TRM90649]MDF5755944.1 zinc-binding dehydrogenase [Spongiactinospora sp. TRM90649]
MRVVRVVRFGGPEELVAKGVRVLGIEQLFEFGPTVTRWAERMMSKAAAGLVRPLIGRTFPPARAADAHAAIEERTAVGKTLPLT